jgi:hypothetical protein
MALLAEGNEAEPTLVQYDHWGRRVDMLKTSEGWRGLKGVAAAEGCVRNCFCCFADTLAANNSLIPSFNDRLVADPIEQTYGEYSRLWAFTKGYLMVPEGRCKILFPVYFSITFVACFSNIGARPFLRVLDVGCPISMTDGCATVLQLVGTPKMKAEILPRLISREPNIAWTAGQLMTERPGSYTLFLHYSRLSRHYEC